jgi:hypothetical protein
MMILGCSKGEIPIILIALLKSLSGRISKKNNRRVKNHLISILGIQKVLIIKILTNQDLLNRVQA